SAAGSGAAGTRAVWKVQVLRVGQQPYQNVTFRVIVDGSVGDTMFAGFKIWDARTRSVYSSSSITYTQLYQAAAISLHWSKRGYDGNTVPRGAGYYVEAFITDYTSHG